MVKRVSLYSHIFKLLWFPLEIFVKGKRKKTQTHINMCKIMTLSLSQVDASKADCSLSKWTLQVLLTKRSDEKLLCFSEFTVHLSVYFLGDNPCPFSSMIRHSVCYWCLCVPLKLLHHITLACRPLGQWSYNWTLASAGHKLHPNC